MTVWQIASGDRGRDYSQLCIKHDLMLLGPGNPGEFTPAAYESSVRSGRISSAKASALSHFKNRVEAGDVVLLRNGHRVLALGIVADEGYAWRTAFDDVQGWNLQHTHRVLWQDQFQDTLDRRHREGALFSNRLQIPMFTKVRDDHVLSRLKDLLIRVKSRKLRRLPPEPSPILDDVALGRELFSKGLSHRATEDVLAALNRQRRLQEWYDEHGRASGRPRESEVVAHIVLPLLLALGWSEQLLAVEWNHIDLAGFSDAPTTSGNCVLVCEAKGPEHGLSGVFEQARKYVSDRDLHNCNRILLTEGGRYFIYSRSGRTWRTQPYAYLNVAKPRRQNADQTSAITALLALRQGG